MFLSVPQPLHHCQYQMFLSLGEQDPDLAVGLIADGVDPRSESFARQVRVLAEKSLDLVMMLLEDRENLMTLRGS